MIFYVNLIIKNSFNKKIIVKGGKCGIVSAIENPSISIAWKGDITRDASWEVWCGCCWNFIKKNESVSLAIEKEGGRMVGKEIYLFIILSLFFFLYIFPLPRKNKTTNTLNLDKAIFYTYNNHFRQPISSC